MTQESLGQILIKFGDQPPAGREVEHVFATKPHRLASHKGWPVLSAWSQVVGREDFASVDLSEVPEAILVGVAASVDEVLKQIAFLKREIAKLSGKIEGLTHQVEEQGYSRLAVITDLGEGEFDLVAPMTITLEEFPEEYLARVPELDLFASADSESAAIELLKQDIRTLFEELRRAPPKKLGRAPQRWLEILSKMIRQRT